MSHNATNIINAINSINANLYAQLAAHFPQQKHTPAIALEDGSFYSWLDIEHASARIAHLLTSLNLKKQARIAVQVEKSAEFICLYLASLRAGYVFLPLNTAYKEKEIEYFLSDAEADVFVCSPMHFASLSQLAKRVGCDHVFTLDAPKENEKNSGSLLEQASTFPDEFNTVISQDHDLAAILYTSGTTGRSKGAMLSHRNLFSNAQDLVELWQFTEHDVLLHALPLFHIHGLFVACHCALLSGCQMRLLKKFDAQQILTECAQATVLMGVPTFYVRLLQEPALNRIAMQRMRLFISGSAPLLSEHFIQFKERTGHAILERYGMSETGILSSNPYQGERKPNTVGPALAQVGIRIVDEHNKLCLDGDIGSIQVRGPNVFLGYWNRPEKTQEEMSADGFFTTGDLGRWDESAYLQIVGRNKDLIISGGYNVYPKEIETLLDSIEEVEESAVIGLADADLGESVTAILVLKKSKQIDVSKLILDLKQKIANYKVPKRIFFVDELPRNAMGKVQKNILRTLFSDAT
jgi:malonyl-CoA/methylmalonyl-CoA synthetase